jgi:rRNA maturation protein Nop10
MDNTQTIYKCSKDETAWYGSNQTPEACPVCGSEGFISEPQEFASSTEQNEAEAVIAAEPVEAAVEAPQDVTEVSEDSVEPEEIEI